MKKLFFLVLFVPLLSLACSCLGAPTTNGYSYKEVGRDYRVTVKAIAIYGMKDTAVQMRINGAIQGTVDRRIAEFKSKKNVMIESRLNTMDIDGVVMGLLKKYLSVKFSCLVFYSGAAHPEHWIDTLTFDLKTGKAINIQALHTPGADCPSRIRRYSRSALLAKVKELGSDPDWIDRGTKLIPENYRYFNLTKKALVIIFPEYQVAPYGAGEQVVAIPYQEVPTIRKVVFN